MEIEIGKITHYFNKIGVAVVEVKDKIKVGDKIHIKGHTTDFTQIVKSMQINHKDVKEAKPGDSIGLKVEDRVREGDLVYKVVEEVAEETIEKGKEVKKRRGRPKKKT